MKFRVTMKDPDTLYNSINEVVRSDVAALGLSRDEADAVMEERTGAVRDVCKTWFRYGEVLTVEVDTEAKTCVVIESPH